MKVYNNGVWRYAILAYGFLNLTFLLGIACAILGAIATPTWFLPAFLLLAPTLFGLLTAAYRKSTFSRAMPEFKAWFERSSFGEAIGSLIVPWIMTYCIIKSCRTHEIEWRGRTYKLPE
jgi:hypothetical protein